MKTYESRVLFYDIETTYLLARIWRPGEQVVRHNQLVEGYDVTNIICIGYAWNDGKPAKALVWDEDQNSSRIIEEFDKLVKKADIIIGKNNNKFDDKHINTQRMLHQLEPMPYWVSKTDDLEKQFRKHFNFPSQSLDYISKLFGIGGKIPMEMQDWVKIQELGDKAALKKMVTYCKKDVEDTRYIYYQALPYITPKLNRSAYDPETLRCVYCGSADIEFGDSPMIGHNRYQLFDCKGHGGYAGKARINKDGIIRRLNV